LVSKSVFQAFQLTTADIMQAPGARAMWLNLRRVFPQAYRAFIDDAMRDSPGARAGDDLKLWNAALAEVGTPASKALP
jgi:hypothetical protein